MDWGSPWPYFYDSVLRAPTIGCMLMGLSAALVGVVVFLRRQSLLGESLSHASYPGVILGILVVSSYTGTADDGPLIAAAILIGAFASALLGLWIIEGLQSRLRVCYDSALCFVLAGFFGVGITMASRVQFTHTSLYRQIQVYLYGQAATMRDFHIFLYAVLAIVVMAAIALAYKELQAAILDKDFSQTIGIRTKAVNTGFFLLIVLAVVIGIRCVGVVLMSAMLIAPAAAARQFTQRLWQMFVLAGAIGMLCGFTGNYLSVELSSVLATDSGRPLTLPTGPMVVLSGTFICLLSLLFAPERGLVVRYFRLVRFRERCRRENLLKALWRIGAYNQTSLSQLRRYYEGSGWYMRWMLRDLAKDGLVTAVGISSYRLTEAGRREGGRVVRLHRLWELYLVDELGVGAEKVHRSAEEIEHILTPELERQLTELLNDPKRDPHQQPIPPEDVMNV